MNKSQPVNKTLKSWPVKYLTTSVHFSQPFQPYLKTWLSYFVTYLLVGSCT